MCGVNTALSNSDVFWTISGRLSVTPLAPDFWQWFISLGFLLVHCGMIITNTFFQPECPPQHLCKKKKKKIWASGFWDSVYTSGNWVRPRDRQFMQITLFLKRTIWEGFEAETAIQRPLYLSISSVSHRIRLQLWQWVSSWGATEHGTLELLFWQL